MSDFKSMNDGAVCELVPVITPDEIRALRKKLNLSQGDLAKRLGIDVRVLQNWEGESGKPSGVARALLRNLIKTIKQKNDPTVAV